MRGFRRRQTTTKTIRKPSRSNTPAKSHQHAPQRKPPDTTILDTFAISKRCFKKMSCSRRLFVYACFGAPLGHHARSAKSLHLGQPPPPGAQTPQSLYSCSATTPNHSASFFTIFYDLQSAAYFVRFSKILASIQDFSREQASKFQRSSEKSSNVLVALKDSSKKQVSQFPSCRGGLGEAPYNTPRHSLQRCRSKALKDVGIRKLSFV